MTQQISHYWIEANDPTLSPRRRKTTFEGVPYSGSLGIAIKFDPTSGDCLIAIHPSITPVGTYALQLQADNTIAGDVWYTPNFPPAPLTTYPWNTDPAGLPGLLKL
jgi:hypothetical protein